jgi:hypothetical protein
MSETHIHEKTTAHDNRNCCRYTATGAHSYSGSWQPRLIHVFLLRTLQVQYVVCVPSFWRSSFIRRTVSALLCTLFVYAILCTLSTYPIRSTLFAYPLFGVPAPRVAQLLVHGVRVRHKALTPLRLGNGNGNININAVTAVAAQHVQLLSASQRRWCAPEQGAGLQ